MFPSSSLHCLLVPRNCPAPSHDTYMRLTWLVERGSVQQVAPIFKIVVAIFLLYIVVRAPFRGYRIQLN